MNRNWLLSQRHRALQAAVLILPLFVYTVVRASQGPAPAPASPADIDFTRDIQPILAHSCYQCHGAKVQMAGLRLDAKASALRGGQSGAVIIPGNSKDSLLYQRITGAGELARMPMGGKPLVPEQIAALTKWIDAGAVWPDSAGAPAIAEVKRHWAFIPPDRPAIPPVSKPEWVRNPIDAFVLARLDKEGLHASADADRVTLLRRLSLDLTGLPPTIEEAGAFLADNRRDAFERQVERLLASPHYGERWGRMWLDAARYADSNGFEKDAPRSVWAYRDWVIDALNRDLPYDQFVIQQIAGDLLPKPTQDQIVATGFLRNSLLNEEGGVDPEQFRMEAMFDRMDAVGKGILGITIQCAQCHNHKFDPLTQEEYYRLFAFLNSTHEANIAVYSPQQQQKRAEIYQHTQEIESALQHRHPDWRTRMAEWESRVKNDQPEWTVLHSTVDDISTGGSRYLPQTDGSFIAQGFAPTSHRVKFIAKTDLPNVTAFRLELLTDPNLPCGGPGRSLNGSGVLTEFEVEAAPAAAPDKTSKIHFVKATSDLDLPSRPLPPKYQDRTGNTKVIGPIEYAIDGKDETGWSTDAGPGLRNQPRKAVFVAEKPIANPGGTVLNIYLKQDHGGINPDDNEANNLGRLRLSITTAPDAVADRLPAKVREILAIPEAQRTPAQMHAVFSYWRTTVAELKEDNAAIAALWRDYPEGATQLVLEERQQLRETHVLKRGDFLQPARVVSPGVPAFLPPLPAGAPVDRLSFARWLVDRGSPTTARSIVNRVWQGYFGTGIVATAENFGTQSEPPTHPQLLDWLAVEFMDSGWNLKKLHRLIVTSATYRQSSKVSPELLAKDPANRLLARGPRFRVDAEIVRDIALQASGLLNERVGGPSVFPPAPAFLFVPPASYAPKTWQEDTGPERYRRALYTFRFRSVPYPVLQTFDAPNGESSCVRRGRSNTPLQALTTLNEPLFIEAARALALRAIKQGGATDQDRLNYAFRLCVARTATPRESDVLLTLLRKEKKRLSLGWLSARELTGFAVTDKSPLPENVTPNDWAGWTAVSRVLLNLDETITKE